MSNKKVETHATVHPYTQYVDQVTDVGAALDKAIKSISQRMGTVRRDIAIAAASCVLHTVQHGNITVATQLVDAVKGMRQNALRDWFLAFGPYDWDEENEVFKLSRDKRETIRSRIARDGNTIGFAKAMLSEPFWEWKPEPVFKPFNLRETLLRALGQATKRASKADERDDLTGIDDLRAFIEATFKPDNDPRSPEDTKVVAVGIKKKAA